MMQRYFWLVYLLLVTALAALSALLVRSYISAQLAAPLVTTATSSGDGSKPLAQKAELGQYEVVTKRNIFNANPPAEAPPTPAAEPTPAPQPPPEVPLTPLQVKLMGTIAGTRARDAAIIEAPGQPGGQAIYQLGDTIQQATLVEIRPDCVVFERAKKQRETVCFQQDSAPSTTPQTSQSVAPAQPQRTAAAPSTAMPLPTPSRAGEAGGVVQVDPSTWRLSRSLLLEHFANVGSLSSQANITPYFLQGQQQGFRLSQLKPNSVLQQIGLTEGDVLQKVNGLDIHSPQEALQAYQQLQSENTVRVNILRNNRPTTLTYELR